MVRVVNVKTEKKRDPRGSKPGERRGGRQKGTPNKTTRAAREEFLPFADMAKRKIVYLIDNAETEDLQFRAAQEVHNRVYGKPTQQTNLAGHDGGPLDLTGLDDAALDAAIARLAAVAGQDR